MSRHMCITIWTWSLSTIHGNHSMVFQSWYQTMRNLQLWWMWREWKQFLHKTRMWIFMCRLVQNLKWHCRITVVEIYFKMPALGFYQISVKVLLTLNIPFNKTHLSKCVLISRVWNNDENCNNWCKMLKITKYFSACTN